MKKQKIIIGVLALTLGLLLTAVASAEEWACFGKSEKINFCNPKTPDRTCGDSECRYCVSQYDSVNDCYNQGNFNVCNSIAPQCTLFGDESDIDSEPPILNILNPSNNEVFTERSIVLDMTVNEKVDISYIDNINGRGRMSRLCQNCMSYQRSRSFNEGLNDITVRATDLAGNPTSKILKFFIDSKTPKIMKTSPKKGFSSGLFMVEFKEINPKSLILHYGNNIIGFKTAALDINKCGQKKDKYNCTASVNVVDFNGKNMSYWFELTDIVDRKVSSRHIDLFADTTVPVINFLNTDVHDNHLMLEMSVSEPNFDSIEYIDNSASRSRWKTLCSSLKDELCERKITLSEGSHDIDVKVSDLAGNSVNRNIDILIG